MFCKIYEEDILWNISSPIKKEEWVDRWSMERIKRMHPSPQPLPVTSNSQCCTSIIIKHKEIATFPSSILHHLLKKVNRKVQGCYKHKSRPTLWWRDLRTHRTIAYHVNTKNLFVCLCWGLTSQSTIFQSCRDGKTQRICRSETCTSYTCMSWQTIETLSKS